MQKSCKKDDILHTFVKPQKLTLLLSLFGFPLMSFSQDPIQDNTLHFILRIFNIK